MPPERWVRAAPVYALGEPRPGESSPLFLIAEHTARDDLLFPLAQRPPQAEEGVPVRGEWRLLAFEDLGALERVLGALRNLGTEFEGLCPVPAWHGYANRVAELRGVEPEALYSTTPAEKLASGVADLVRGFQGDRSLRNESARGLWLDALESPGS